MNYDEQILKVLLEAGSEGISLQKISRHVYNACNSFFYPISYSDVYAYVSQYLNRHSKDQNSAVEKGPERGVYRLNINSLENQQLMLQFEEISEESTEKQAYEDNSLQLCPEEEL